MEMTRTRHARGTQITPKRWARQRRTTLTIIADPATTERRRNDLLTESIPYLERRLDEVPACRNCGTAMTDPVSIDRHIGRECWAKGVRS